MASGISINSNLAAMSALRRLTQSTGELGQSFTRLASGLRINRSVDDAAGMAISSSLNVDQRVFSQGVRNLNDAISLLNVAEGSLQELSSILIRQRELASQAANGTLGRAQRVALEQEANALVGEYNRIVGSTSFNNLSLLVEDQSELKAQGGYGEDGGIAFTLGEAFARDVSDGTVQTQVTDAIGGYGFHITKGDFDRDGDIDIINASGLATVMLNDGNGNFTATQQLDAPVSVEIRSGDFNGDGNLDFAVANYADSKIGVFIGNGDGTFKSGVEYASDGQATSLAVADFDGDNVEDIVVANHASQSVTVLRGTGNGSFTKFAEYDTNQVVQYVTTYDVNGDSLLDVVTGGNDGAVEVLLSNGDGSLRSATEFISGAGIVYSLGIGDVNGDGFADVSTSNYGESYGGVLLGNGNGTFKGIITVAFGGDGDAMEMVDLNEDGHQDLLYSIHADSRINVMLGNGNGTFKGRVSFSNSASALDLAIADFNGDGGLDIVSANGASDTIGFFESNLTDRTTISPISFRTRLDALDSMAVIDAGLERVTSELGVIGAAQSRIAVAIQNLGSSIEGIASASSRIMDVDVAEESARLISRSILQQAGQAVLVQANQVPQIALTLLSGI